MHPQYKPQKTKPPQRHTSVKPHMHQAGALQPSCSNSALRTDRRAAHPLQHLLQRALPARAHPPRRLAVCDAALDAAPLLRGRQNSSALPNACLASRQALGVCAAHIGKQGTPLLISVQGIQQTPDTLNWQRQACPTCGVRLGESGCL